MSVGFSFKVGGKFSVPTFTFSGKVGQTDTVPVHLLELLLGAGIMFDMTYTILYITKTNTIIIFSPCILLYSYIPKVLQPVTLLGPPK